jgi:glycosyltransferase involved in cell wall biosynthesis
MENPLVTVIIPTYNYGELLRPAVKSVLDQTYTNLELLIIDDCSPVPSIEGIRDLVEADPRVRVIRNEKNLNVSGARNVGITQARGELIALLDHDDGWLPLKLEKEVELMRDPQYAACITDTISYESPSYNRRNSKKDLKWIIITGTFTGMGSGMLARRTTFDQVGFFHLGIRTVQDWDWLMRMHIKGLKMGIVPQQLTIYAGVHRRPTAVEIEDINIVNSQYADQLKGSESKLFNAAVKWRIALIEFIGKKNFPRGLKLAWAALQSPINFSKYAWTIYEGTLRKAPAPPEAFARNA